MTDKPLKLDSTGELAQIIPPATSGGSSDAGKLFVLGPDGKIDESFLHSSIEQIFTASENIAAGALINIFDSGAGVMKMRNATAASNTPAHGFATESVTSGNDGPAILGEGIVSGLTLTAGAKYFLDPATPGGVVTPAPTYSTGQICQYVGVAISDSELAFTLERIVKIA